MDLFNQTSNYRKRLRQSAFIPVVLSLLTLVTTYLLYAASWDILVAVLAAGACIVIRIPQSFFYQLRRQIQDRTQTFRISRWHTFTSTLILAFTGCMLYAAFQLDPATVQPQSLANTKFFAVALFGIIKVNVGYWALVKKLVVEKRWQRIKQDRPPIMYR